MKKVLLIVITLLTLTACTQSLDYYDSVKEYFAIKSEIENSGDVSVEESMDDLIEKAYEYFNSKEVLEKIERIDQMIVDIEKTKLGEREFESFLAIKKDWSKEKKVFANVNKWYVEGYVFENNSQLEDDRLSIFKNMISNKWSSSQY